LGIEQVTDWSLPMSTLSTPFACPLFITSLDSPFAIVHVSRGSAVLPARAEIHRQVALMRENVFVGGGHLRGPEGDADDDRAHSIAIVENLGDGFVRICGHVRLIPRTVGDSESALPIEHYFPRALPRDREGRPDLAGAFEISRLFTVHEEARLQARMLVLLIAYAAGLAASLGWGTAYAMLGSELLRVFRAYVPAMEPLAEGRLLESYPTAKTPVRIRREDYERIALPEPRSTYFAPGRG